MYVLRDLRRVPRDRFTALVIMNVKMRRLERGPREGGVELGKGK